MYGDKTEAEEINNFVFCFQQAKCKLNQRIGSDFIQRQQKHFKIDNSALAKTHTF